MSKDETLSIEVYAKALAHLLRRRGEPIREVLGSLEITPEAFSDAERRFTAELAESFHRRRGLLAMTFSSALAQAQTELGPLDPAAGAPRPVELASAPQPQRAAEMPSFLREDRDGAHAAPIPPLTPITMGPQAAPNPAPPSSAPIPPAPIGNIAPVAAPPPPAIVTPAVVPPAVDRRTGAMAAVAGPSPALPFAPGAPSTLPASSPLPPVLPQGPGTGTAMMDADAPVQPAVPWAGTEDIPPLPSLSIEHYAALVVLLARRPADPAAVLARYGIQSAEEHAQMEQAFRAHFKRDPALRTKYEGLVIRYTSAARG